MGVRGGEIVSPPLGVSVVVVTFHTDAAMLEAALASAVESARRAGLNPEIVVVDNASPAPPVLPDLGCETHLVLRGTNDGFGVAANAGVRAARAPLVYCVNPDTQTSPEALSALDALRRAHPRSLCMGWLQQGGRPQVDASLLWLYSTGRLLRRRAHRVALAKAAAAGTPLMVEKVSGGALFASRDHLVELGPFAEEFFLYGEDADLSVRARAAGFTLLAVPAAPVEHQAATSQEHHGTIVEQARVDAALRLVQRHRGTPARMLALVELYLVTRLGLLMAARTSSRNSTVRRSRLVELRRWCTLTPPPKFTPSLAGDDAAGTPVSPGRPRLLVLTPWLEGGGAQRSLAEVLPALREEFHVTVATLFGGCRDHEALLDSADATCELSLPRSPLGVLRAARALPGVLEGHEVVFSLLRGGHLVYGMIPRTRLPRHRLVIAQHADPAADAEGLRGRLEDVFVRRTFAAAEAVITPAPFAAEWLASHDFTPGERIWVVPNPLTPDDRPLMSVRSGALVPLRLGFTGRLEREKGLDLLLGVLATTDTPRCHLRVAGEGSQRRLLESLAEAARARGHSVEFLGHVEDPVVIYDWCDVLVVPSRSELFGYSISEAWARGRGALTSDTAGLRARAGSGPITPLAMSAEVWAQALGQWAREDSLRERAFLEGPAAVRAGSHAPRTYTELMQGRRPAALAPHGEEPGPQRSQAEPSENRSVQ